MTNNIKFYLNNWFVKLLIGQNVYIFNCFRSSKTDKTDLVNMVNVCHALLVSLSGESDNQESSAALSSELLVTISNESKKRWLEPIEKVCNGALSVHGHLSFCQYSRSNLELKRGFWNPLKRIEISSYCRAIIFSVKLIFRLLGENCDETNCETSSQSIIADENLSRLDNLIVDLAYSLALIRTVSNYYSSVSIWYFLWI